MLKKIIPIILAVSFCYAGPRKIAQAPQPSIVKTVLCKGRQVWVKIWEQQNAQGQKFLAASSNWLTQGSSPYGNLFGPEVLRTSKNQVISNLSQFKQLKVAVDKDSPQKTFTLNLNDRTATFTKKGRTLLKDRFTCQTI